MIEITTVGEMLPYSFDMPDKEQFNSLIDNIERGNISIGFRVENTFFNIKHIKMMRFVKNENL